MLFPAWKFLTNGGQLFFHSMSCFDNLSTGQDTVCKEMAKAELQKRADKFVQGNIEIEFAPKARSGGTLQIEGKNAPWPMTKAKFRISEVTHTYRDGEAPFTTIEFYSDSLPT